MAHISALLSGRSAAVRATLAVCVACSMFPARSQSLEITLLVSGIEDPSGNLLIGVHDRPETYLSEDAFREIIAPVQEKGTVVIRIRDIPPGEYAVCIFHDVNKNGRLDKNFLGIPSEPYGFSNDAKGFLGPPGFSDAVVVVADGDEILRITLH